MRTLLTMTSRVLMLTLFVDATLLQSVRRLEPFMSCGHPGCCPFISALSASLLKARRKRGVHYHIHKMAGGQSEHQKRLEGMTRILQDMFDNSQEARCCFLVASPKATFKVTCSGSHLQSRSNNKLGTASLEEDCLSRSTFVQKPRRRSLLADPPHTHSLDPSIRVHNWMAPGSSLFQR